MSIRLSRFPADKTNNRLGVSEMLIASSINGLIFGLASGQPLLILGPTGPFLVFEEMVFDVRERKGISRHLVVLSALSILRFRFLDSSLLC